MTARQCVRDFGAASRSAPRASRLSAWSALTRDAVQVRPVLSRLRVAYTAILARGRAGARGATPNFQIANGRLGAAVGFAAPSRPVRWACQDFDSLNRGYACLVQSGSRLLHFQFLEISVCSFHDRHWYGLG